ncbi:putative porin [Chitinophaga japonensis]|uniref:Putative beta-barrel porin n=1 Tax=Chitinophaga japonensis TaxID=104662 RepID=A0A562SJ74_CHIJA|nr:putative porin [Chitinophaga japonensis]TWI81024.1 putative beta-barrel porin [Chitinophaga japonensis]
MRHLFIILGLLVTGGSQVMAQFNTGGFGNFGAGGNTRMQRDTSQRNLGPDTLTLKYHYLNDPVQHRLDSSVIDFTGNYLGVPASYVTLGNTGSAARNIIFTPRMQAGFDEGFHAYDVYGFSHENARFYNTTRPYSELQYLIGAKQEQVIGVSHTQNRNQYFNFSFDYRKINAPGYFRTQNTNHDLYRVTANYKSKNLRYHAYLSYYYNKINGGENGGIRDASYLDSSRYSNRRTIDVNLGNEEVPTYAFFGTTIAVKSTYQQRGILLEQQYDWGKGDTVHVNDTTQYYKFDPVFRVQYTFKSQSNTYEFTDNDPDQEYYPLHYDIVYKANDTIHARQQWRTLSNDLSLIQFPVRGNLAHFINLGARFDHTRGEFPDNVSQQFNNLALHGEYRNKTRNERWDFSAKGEFYAVGRNLGDYSVSGMLSRYLNETLGNVSLLFRNVNREPSYVYKFFSYNRDSWYNTDLGKENITQLQFSADNKKLKYNLVANYYIYNQYTYFTDYMHSAQASGLFNLLQVIFSKHFRVKHWNWYADIAFQQVHGNGPVNVPTIWTRHRIAYENRLFNNLNLMTGIEARYNTDYYADDYSPLQGQFVYQNTQKVGYNLPDLTAFLHFRIKSLSAYIRAENLNTFLATNNFAAPLYPLNDFGIRVGLRWWFIN